MPGSNGKTGCQEHFGKEQGHSTPSRLYFFQIADILEHKEGFNLSLNNQRNQNPSIPLIHKHCIVKRTPFWDPIRESNCSKKVPYIRSRRVEARQEESLRFRLIPDNMKTNHMAAALMKNQGRRLLLPTNYPLFRRYLFYPP